MKNLITKLLLFTGIVALLQGCSLGDDTGTCYNRALVTTLGVTGPQSTQVNVEVEFMVTFPLLNSCGTFVEIAEVKTTFPKEIAAAVDYNGCDCAPVTTQLTKPYKFKASTPGNYELRFLTDNEDVQIIKTIVVTE